MTTTPRTAPDVVQPPRGSRLPALAQTFLYGKYRHLLLPRVQRRHGDVFTLKLAQFADTVTVLANPAHFRAVFGGPTTTFHAGYAVLAPVMGHSSVLIADEDEHKRLRRLVMPAFSGAALTGYQQVVAELARQEISRWPLGRPLTVYPRMQALTLEVILKVVFGVTDAERLREMRPLVYQIASIGPLTLLGLTSPTLRRLPPWRQLANRQRRLDELLHAEISERRGTGGHGDRKDVLTQLVRYSAQDSDQQGLSDDELRDQLITLLLAGHETSSASLAWTLHELSRRPDLLEAAHEAAVAGNEEYLSAIAKETLRLYPVVYEVARKLAAPVEIAGYRLPTGSAVMPAVGLVHADPEHFDRPATFDPARFLDGQPPAHTWLPFGGGARRCVGAGFAIMEMTVVLAELLRTHHIRPEAARPERAYVRNVTLVPRHGTRVVPTLWPAHS
ncbi:cytochrome P450 [Micromonospora carbonacea]|uniref:cytochrome P450 n=1 Tax=Micromonospora carbonacea TaxID=47853 RepID=UPI003D95ACC8